MARHGVARAAAPRSDDVLQDQIRQALWSSYFGRFFGDPRRDGRGRGSFAPISFDAAMDHLDACFCRGSTPHHATDDVLRRCVSQMLLRGYEPPPRFQGILETASDGMKGRAARDFLVSWGEREFDLPSVSQRRTAIDEDLRALGPDHYALSLPTRMTHRGDAYTVEKRAYFRRELAQVRRLVNPVNWRLLGEFFRTTKRLRPRPGPRSDAVSWHGVLFEEFVFSWNGFNTNVFTQQLKIDFSVTSTSARADYSLMFEEHGEILVNEGFFEVQAEPGLQGWIRVTMQKTVRFTSTLLNMLAPAILSMFLDSKAGGFARMIDTSIGRGQPSR